jgi:hypothetical protein
VDLRGRDSALLSQMNQIGLKRKLPQGRKQQQEARRSQTGPQCQIVKGINLLGIVFCHKHLIPTTVSYTAEFCRWRANAEKGI